MEIVRKAQRFATEKHRGQRSKHHDAPYTDHLRSVVSLLRAYGQKDSHIIAAAWLHDTVEKTEATLHGIVDEFGDGIGEFTGLPIAVKAKETFSHSPRHGGWAAPRGMPNSSNSPISSTMGA
jgi:2-iminoacetate synthase ThiH